MKLKLVEGGAYSMQYERDGQAKTVTGTLSNYYIAPVELTNKLWAAVMGAKPDGQLNDGDMYPVTMVNYNKHLQPRSASVSCWLLLSENRRDGAPLYSLLASKQG